MFCALQPYGCKPAPKALFMHVYNNEVSTPVAKQLRHIAIFSKWLIHSFLKHLLRACYTQSPVVSKRGFGLEETAALWLSQADRPGEGPAEAEPDGIINRGSEKKLSFLKHMGEV